MPICERDPWRDQYFENIPCPDNVLIPTDDFDAWPWYPKHNWIYDKLRMAQSQGFTCGPHGVMPPAFPVFSKPITNLKGMGVGSRVIARKRKCWPAHPPAISGCPCSKAPMSQPIAPSSRAR